MAEYLNLKVKDFKKNYTKEGIFGGLWLVDKPNMDCIFLEDNKCSINEVKPYQCSKFPHEWANADTKTVCPAINELLKNNKNTEENEIEENQ